MLSVFQTISNMGASQGLKWADIEDDSDDDTIVESGLGDTSMGVKRESDIQLNCSSWRTDDGGYDDGYGGHRKRSKFSESAPEAQMPVSSLVSVAFMVPVIMGPFEPIAVHQYTTSPLTSEVTEETSNKNIEEKRPIKQTTEEKRKDDIALIRREFPEDVVAQTPMGRAGSPNVLSKRVWEEAKAEYRNTLKLWQLKIQTSCSEKAIKHALEVVHEKKMPAQVHVNLALAHLMREC